MKELRFVLLTILPFSSQAQTLLAQTLPSKFAPCHIRSRPKRSQALNAQRKTHPPSCTPPIPLCQSVCQRVFCASSDLMDTGLVQAFLEERSDTVS